MRPAAPPLILPSSPPLGDRLDETAAPRADFEVMSRRLPGRIAFPGPAASPVEKAESRLRLDVSQAVRARRTPASVYVSFSERVGIPLSLLRPRARHLLIAHLLTSDQKRLMQRVTRFLRGTDLTLVFSRPQERYLRDEIGLEPDRVRFIWDKVDHRFYTPERTPQRGGYVLSVGREQRDYRTLIDALTPLRLPAVIVPGSSWSHRRPAPLPAPDHIEVREGLSFPELRELYRGARIVVVPVQRATDYAAGVNTIHEGMACGRPVVASKTPGLTGYIADGRNGRQVPAGDPDALRAVIEELWENAGLAESLGETGRATVERERTVDHFVTRVAGHIDSLV